MLVSLLYKLLRFLNLQLNIFNHIKAKHVIKQMVMVVVVVVVVWLVGYIPLCFLYFFIVCTL